MFELLLNCWERKTAYPASQADYDKSNDPTCGQCAITATVVHDLFGGTHYFNKTDGRYIDLTKDQFDLYNIPISYEPNEVVNREYCNKNLNTLTRYNKLVENLKNTTRR